MSKPTFNIGDNVIIRSIQQPGIVVAVDSQQFGVPNNHTYAIKIGDCFVNRIAYENLKLA